MAASLLVIVVVEQCVKRIDLGLDTAQPILVLIANMLKIICLGWLLQRVVSGGPRQWLDVLVLAAGVGFLLIYQPFVAYQVFEGGGRGMDQLVVSIALVLFLVFYRTGFATRTLSYLGKISYSLYLLHPVVMYSTLWWVV